VSSRTGVLDAARRSIAEALANPGIRRLEVAWAIGIAADTGLMVVFLVAVYQRDGALGTGLLGAFRMLPATVAGMLAGSILGRFRGDRLLAAVGLTRAAAAGLGALVIVTGGGAALLYALAAIAAAAGALVRPTQITLMPAFARTPGELVAANTAWSTGEGAGAFAGPLVVGVLVGAGLGAAGALVAAVGFLATSAVVIGLRFEHAQDARAGLAATPARERLLVGLRAMRQRPVLAWAIASAYGQVVTRGLLASFSVVAAIELLGMGEPGVGLLNAALGLGGLLGAVFAVSLARADRLVRTLCASLAYWGAPIAIIALLPFPSVAVVAMVVIGVANATYDVALFTLLQRGATNEERGGIFSLLEGAIGLGSVTGSLLAPVLLALFGTKGALAVGGAFLPILALIVYGRIGRSAGVAIVDERTISTLRHVPFFAELPLTAVERLAAGLTPATFPEGATLMRQGDEGDRFIVVRSGEVEVLVDGRPITRLGPGDGVGEIALLRRSRRTATVVALTDVEGFAIGCETFLAATAGPAAALTAERMADANLRRAAPPDIELGAA
jgi:predicted MFS family arabinose efflux permease